MSTFDCLGVLALNCFDESLALSRTDANYLPVIKDYFLNCSLVLFQECSSVAVACYAVCAPVLMASRVHSNIKTYLFKTNSCCVVVAG